MEFQESTEGLDDIRIGDLANTSLMEVKNRVGKHKNLETNYHEGLVPDTFDGLEKSKITFLHIDLDMYVSVRAALDWTYTRLVSGAFVVLDDYGKPGTYGAKKATDEFLADKPESLFFSANWAGLVHKKMTLLTWINHSGFQIESKSGKS